MHVTSNVHFIKRIAHIILNNIYYMYPNLTLVSETIYVLRQYDFSYNPYAQMDINVCHQLDLFYSVTFKLSLSFLFFDNGSTTFSLSVRQDLFPVFLLSLSSIFFERSLLLNFLLPSFNFLFCRFFPGRSFFDLLKLNLVFLLFCGQATGTWPAS